MTISKPRRLVILSTRESAALRARGAAGDRILALAMAKAAQLGAGALIRVRLP